MAMGCATRAIPMMTTTERWMAMIQTTMTPMCARIRTVMVATIVLAAAMTRPMMARTPTAMASATAETPMTTAMVWRMALIQRLSTPMSAPTPMGTVATIVPMAAMTPPMTVRTRMEMARVTVGMDVPMTPTKLRRESVVVAALMWTPTAMESVTLRSASTLPIRWRWRKI